MRNNFQKIMVILPKGDRRQFYVLFLAMLAMGMLEVGGIGAIMPFMAAVSDMDGILEHKQLHYLYELIGFNSSKSFVMFLGSAVLTLLIARNIFYALSNWLVSRYSLMWRHHLSEQLLRKYLMQPYAFFLSNNTLELKRNVTDEVTRLVNGVIIPGIELLAKVIIAFFIVIFLVVIDPFVALMVAAIFGGSYAILYGLVFRKLNRLGRCARDSRRAQFKLAGEAFEGIKLLKLSGRENHFIDEYSVLSYKSAVIETFSRVISQLPRYGIETLAVSTIMLFLLYLVGSGKDVSSWVPLLVVYVVAGYRILPALQKIFSGQATIRYNLVTLDSIYRHFTSLEAVNPHHQDITGTRASFTRFATIRLREIHFRYPQGSDYVLRNLNLTIDRNTTVGLVGPTGSGKTTIVDIMLGLLRPVFGELAVNDILVTPDNVRGWQQCIGYVPQQICLLDDTIAKNIAFGVPDSEIDRDVLEKVTRIANVHDYIVNELPDGYEAIVGQRGLRLSGGQQQRIGIARALYHKPNILVLDEATSALDGVTENVVMDAISRLSHKLTIIMIAHRMNTVKNCDVIHYIDQGRIVSSGTYTGLSESCQHFREMVEA
jgi:ABC-type multidrug transport system fused ATPase/permease subunit